MPEPDADPRLTGCRVLDLTGELGWLCGKILADLGADVVKVEPPGGDPGREGPAWQAWNAGKRGVRLDVEREDGRRTLLGLAARADVLLESFPPGHLDRLGLGWTALHAANPGLVLTSITPYGQEGPLAGTPASDLELMAASGALSLAGDPDRPPVRISQPQAAAWTSAHAALGTLLAFHHSRNTGEGQRVDVSAQASLLPAIVHAPLFWTLLRQIPQRAGPFLTGRNVHGAALRNVWPCRDGYVTFALYGGGAGRHSNRALVEWMAERDAAPDFLLELDWDSFAVTTAERDEIDRVQDAIGAFFLTLTKREFYAGAVERRLLGYEVATVADIATNEQLAARNVWQDLGGVPHPTGWARFDGRPARLTRPAPRLGEHDAELLAQGVGGRLPHEDAGGRLPNEDAGPERVVAGGSTEDGGPQAALAGLRVVELGAFAAGPHVGKHLAEHGAEVVHVETRTRPDGFRTNYPPFKDDKPGLERAGMFAMTHNDKLGVTLNLKTQDGVELCRRLIARADVVIENFTPGTLRGLGLDPAQLLEDNPRLVLLSTCNQGQTGPHAKHAGFGTHLTAMSGFIQLTGWPDRAPSLLWGPYIDYVAVAYGAVAILAALERRRTTGRGCHIDLSQYETGLQFLGPALHDYFTTGRVADRDGNRDPSAAPHGVYLCRADGRERWVALSVHDDGEWARLVDALGRPEWARAPELATATGRRRAQDELEGRLAAWTSALTREEVVAALRAHGVHVAPVQDMADIAEDPQLAVRQAWRPVEHPVIGTYPAVGPSYLLSATPAEIRRPAFLLGEHNREVFCGLLGLSEESYAEGEAAGVFD